MVKVSKAEVSVLRVRAPQAHIAIVNRQSSHKKYYVEESREVQHILRELRGEPERPALKRQRHRSANRRQTQ